MNPSSLVTTKLIASISGIATATTSPARNPSDINDTASTITTAPASACRKCPTASSTTCG
nr:hypothetical protein [Salipiger aestuarii]